jgi:hypothetical protein
LLPMPTREVRVGLPRPHVSLNALLETLETFSERNAVVLVRCWLQRVVCGVRERSSAVKPADTTESPAPPAKDGACRPPDTSEADPGYSDFAVAVAKSAVILGSHTLYELVIASFVDSGLLPDTLHTTDVRRFAYITDKVGGSL